MNTLYGQRHGVWGRENLVHIQKGCVCVKKRQQAEKTWGGDPGEKGHKAYRRQGGPRQGAP